MDRVSIVTEDYEHDDFGRLPGDDKNALGHAAGVDKKRINSLILRRNEVDKR